MLRFYNMLSWKELSQLPPEEVRLILPVSSLEQHGPQLPVGADDLILTKALERLSQEERLVPDFLVLPTIRYGCSAEHMDFCGTVTLTPQTLCAVIEDILSCLKTQGWNKVVLLNSHGGNASLLHAMAQTWKYRYGMEISHIDFWGSGFYGDAGALIDTPFPMDIHAGEIETSILLSALPGLSCYDELEKLENVLTTLPPHIGSWMAAELSPNGMIGGGARATKEKGEALMRYTVDKTIDYLIEICNNESTAQ